MEIEDKAATDTKYFLEVVSKRMKSVGMSQYKAAQKLDVHRTTIKRWLEGDLDINLIDFMRLCSLLEMKVLIAPKK